MKKIIFLILIISSTCRLTADTITVDTLSSVSELAVPESAMVSKADGDSAYIRNDYASAIDIYESLLKVEGESADIYYNLGNSYYKADNIAKAILNYERALLLKPNDKDIRFNLELAYEKTVDKMDPVNEVFFVTWFKSIGNLMAVNGWATAGIITFLLMLVALVIYIFANRILYKKIGFYSFVLLLIIVIATNVFASHQKDSLINRSNAIVISPSVTVKSTPNENGTDLFILHEGHKVSIKDNSMREWKEIELQDGNVGWVPVEVIEVI